MEGRGTHPVWKVKGFPLTLFCSNCRGQGRAIGSDLDLYVCCFKINPFAQGPVLERLVWYLRIDGVANLWT